MAEQTKVCVCPQCGKKYALKDGFDAKSFSCKGCGATVWVAGKPPAPVPTSKGSAPAPRAAGSKGGPRGKSPVAAASHGAGRRSRRGGREEATEEGGRHGRGREKPKSNTNLFLALGGVAAIGIVIVIVVMSGDKEQPGTGTTVGQKPGGAAAAGTTDTTPAPTGTGSETPSGGAPAAVNPTGKPEETKPPASTGEPAEESPSPEGGETTKPKLGDRPPTDKKSKWDPPATLGHLDTTSPEQRKQIDEWIVLMLDPQAGRDSLDAKEKLFAVGKPAFLPILGAMAKIRDTIADTDSPEERLIESSLKLADECLRQMDGYLDANEKAPIRPGTDKKYIEYVLRMHYRRWMDGMGSTPLKDMETMPGAYDASTAYKDEGAEEEEK